MIEISLVDNHDELSIELSTSKEINTDIDIGTVINRGEYPLYEGPYVAVPTIREQIFETDNKAMNSNFKVKEITYLEIPNPSGGFTVTIGEM